jgi:hypothetical protein
MMTQNNSNNNAFLSLRSSISVKEIERLYNEQRLTMTQIAFKFGVTYSYILKLMRTNGIQRRASNDYRKKISDGDLRHS